VLPQTDAATAPTLAVRPNGEAVAAFLGPDGNPADVGEVRIDGNGTTSCGLGCYRGRTGGSIVTVAHGRKTLRFDLGQRTPAAGLIARATARFRALKSVRYNETLTSGLGTTVRTTWTEVAPDRLTYSIAGGAKAVIIGDKRWDLVPGDQWRQSESVVLPMPTPTWGNTVTNARLLRSGTDTIVLSFLEPRSPAWFTVTFDSKTLRPRELDMIAASHFMHERYESFNAPLKIVPPVP
jgi:hypothetical protein